MSRREEGRFSEVVVVVVVVAGWIHAPNKFQ